MQIDQSEYFTCQVPKNLAKYRGGIRETKSGSFLVRVALDDDRRIGKIFPTYELACVHLRILHAVHSLPVRNVVWRFADRLEVAVGDGRRFIVDLDAADLIEKHVWWAPKGYACTKVEGKTVPLHRMLMNPPALLYVDHANGNTLDNRRQNLRICTHAENTRNAKPNSRNTTGSKGVRRMKNGRYRARIAHNGARIALGCYKTLYAAAVAYDAKALELHGKYARTNILINTLI